MRAAVQQGVQFGFAKVVEVAALLLPFVLTILEVEILNPAGLQGSPDQIRKYIIVIRLR
ncbi:hypothetical protein [Desulfurivibrio sp. C05AmB]|uniref:hypothetical protein n=1 Tax=Desulfurivibrio sp. C05AmB TaxID=3374371 RepID=UPI00376F4430